MDLTAIERQRQYFLSGATRSVRFRKEMLGRLLTALSEHEEALLAALRQDLGKSGFEGYETELGLVREEIRYQRKHLAAWSRPVRVKTPLVHFPSRSRVYAEPLGVVLIMSPWNYPLQLTLSPLADALAAGNCAVVKPSRYSAHTAQAIEHMLASAFPPEYVSVYQGGSAVNQELLDVKFDHIFFTGSPAVGRVVMEKAAAHLTPVTLELGGKSPCIVDATADLRLAARRIVWGKCINSGQTCVAPDYLMVHASVREALLTEMKKAVRAFYGEDALKSPDWGSIVNERHFERLSALLSDGTVIEGGKTDPANRKIQPTILTDVAAASPLMTEEIFGPLLPVIAYTDWEEVERRVLSHPKPLALYLFSKDRRTVRRAVERLPFGGGCVNDTVVHLTNPNMQFGGVGESGMGAYHGRKGFETFSHFKPVLTKGRIDIAFRYPPYGEKLRRLKKLMK